MHIYARPSISFQPSLLFDELIINGHEVSGRDWNMNPDTPTIHQSFKNNYEYKSNS